jgi:hypothetical protein
VVVVLRRKLVMLGLLLLLLLLLHLLLHLLGLLMVAAFRAGGGCLGTPACLTDAFQLQPAAQWELWLAHVCHFYAAGQHVTQWQQACEG